MKLTALKSNLSAVPSRFQSIQDATSWRVDKSSSTARGYGYRWQQARARYLRNNPLCVMCKALDKQLRAATVVDHRDPHRGDDARFWDETNWQGLCAHHHSSHKQAQEAKEKAERNG